jgi:hypothetical protein
MMTQTASNTALCFASPWRNFSARTLKFLRRPLKVSWRARARRLNFLTSGVSWGFLIEQTGSLEIQSATTFLPVGILLLSPFGALKLTRSPPLPDGIGPRVHMSLLALIAMASSYVSPGPLNFCEYQCLLGILRHSFMRQSMPSTVRMKISSPSTKSRQTI